MSKKKIVFIINPISGTHSKDEVPNLIEKRLDHELFDYAFVGTTDMEGEDIDLARNVTMALVMCYDYGPQQASLSCISCDFTD